MKTLLKIIAALVIVAGIVVDARAGSSDKDYLYAASPRELAAKNEGFMKRKICIVKGETAKGQPSKIDTIALYDVYALKGKKTRCIGVYSKCTPPRVVFEVGKDVKSIYDLKVDEKLAELIRESGVDNVGDVTDMFLPEQRAFVELLAGQTADKLKKFLPYVECEGYDFHTQTGQFKSNGMFMADVLGKEAMQRYVEKMARKAKYKKSTKREDLMKQVEAKDPETLEFVAKYLTWSGKWNKEFKKIMQERAKR